MWDTLDVPEDHQQGVLKDTGLLSLNLETLQQELERCSTLKLELLHISENIERLREEIVEWTAKCKLVEDYDSPIFGARIYDLPNFNNHKNQLNKLKAIYEESAPILQQLEAYENLKKKLNVLLDNEKKPDFWKNRGGNITKNEKKKKITIQEMVVIEASLKESLQAYRQKFNAPFFVFGMPPTIATTKAPVKIKRYASESNLCFKPRKPFGDRNQ